MDKALRWSCARAGRLWSSALNVSKAVRVQDAGFGYSGAGAGNMVGWTGRLTCGLYCRRLVCRCHVITADESVRFEVECLGRLGSGGHPSNLEHG